MYYTEYIQTEEQKETTKKNGRSGNGVTSDV